MKPVYSSAVDKWRGHIAESVLRDNLKWAPALRTFGYTLFE